MKHRRRWILLLILVLVAPSCRDLAQRRFGFWPKVQSRSDLVQDCAHLLKAQSDQAPLVPSGTPLPKEDWPASVANLHPRAVTLYPGVVNIYISSGGIGASLGYLVIPDEANTPSPVKHPRIRRYKRGIYFWESSG